MLMGKALYRTGRMQTLLTYSIRLSWGVRKAGVLSALEKRDGGSYPLWEFDPLRPRPPSRRRGPQMPYSDPDVQREYQRNWRQARRDEWMKGRSCEDCHEDDERRLHIHHEDPSKKVEHRVWSWRRERRDAELKKCVVLCIGCHADRDARRRRGEGWVYPTAKLTLGQAGQIRTRRGERSAILADEYGVSDRAIRLVWSGITYKGELAESGKAPGC